MKSQRIIRSKIPYAGVLAEYKQMMGNTLNFEEVDERAMSETRPREEKNKITKSLVSKFIKLLIEINLLLMFEASILTCIIFIFKIILNLDFIYEDNKSRMSSDIIIYQSYKLFENKPLFVHNKDLLKWKVNRKNYFFNKFNLWYN